eukprot:2887135-Pleurochrysis_carterae.AAC.1
MKTLRKLNASLEVNEPMLLVCVDRGRPACLCAEKLGLNFQHLSRDGKRRYSRSMISQSTNDVHHIVQKAAIFSDRSTKCEKLRSTHHPTISSDAHHLRREMRPHRCVPTRAVGCRSRARSRRSDSSTS